MRHRLWIVIGVVAVVLLAAAGGIAWYVFGDDAPPKPSIPAASGNTPSSRSTPDGTWVVKPGTDVFVGYRVREKFAGETIKKDAVGRTSAVSGTMRIADDAVTSATVAGDLSELASNRTARDHYLETNALETERFPDVRFVLDGPLDLGTVEQGTEHTYDVTGRLTVHGVTKPVQLTVDARWQGDRIDVAGTAPIVLADYGIETPQTPLVSADGDGSFELQLVFVPAA